MPENKPYTRKTVRYYLSNNKYVRIKSIDYLSHSTSTLEHTIINLTCAELIVWWWLQSETCGIKYLIFLLSCLIWSLIDYTRWYKTHNSLLLLLLVKERKNRWKGDSNRMFGYWAFLGKLDFVVHRKQLQKHMFGYSPTETISLSGIC